LDERAAEYLNRKAKLSKRSTSAEARARRTTQVLSELVAEAARQDARGRALKELGEGIEIPEREVPLRWCFRKGLVRPMTHF
jgi:hypothetical protein